MAVVNIATSGFAAAQVEVSGCGAFVTDGYLSADLDCSSAPPVVLDGPPSEVDAALVVRHKGRLDLRGHTLTATANGRGIYCLRDCIIIGGGGTIVGGTGHIIDSDFGRHVQVESITLTGAGGEGIWTRFKLTVSDSMIRDGAQAGIFAGKTIKLYRTAITNNDESGIVSVGGSVKLEDSRVEGNCIGGESGCVDLATARKPRLERSTCDRSHRGKGSCRDWGVCRDDLCRR